MMVQGKLLNMGTIVVFQPPVISSPSHLPKFALTLYVYLSSLLILSVSLHGTVGGTKPN